MTPAFVHTLITCRPTGAGHLACGATMRLAILIGVISAVAIGGCVFALIAAVRR